MAYTLLATLLIPTLGFPFVYLAGKKSAKAAAIAIAMNWTVLQIITHGISKSLFFLSAGAIMTQVSSRNMRDMGGLAGKMPTTATSSITVALSLAGTPPFVCFISEVLIFVGAFQMIMTTGGSFYIIPTALMLIATVLSLAYSLRFVSNVFFGQPKTEAKTVDVPKFIKAGMIILAVLVVVIGIYPSFFLNWIGTAHFI